LKRLEKLGKIAPIKTSRTIGKGAGTGEIAGNAVLGFILGFKIPYIIGNFSEFKADAAAVILSSLGMIVPGLICAVVFGIYAYTRGEKKKLPKPKIVKEVMHPYQRVGDIALVAAIFGVLGAKLFVVLESKEAFMAFLEHPFEQLFSGAGLAIYGGLILAFIAVAIYTKRLGIPIIHMMDAAAPAIVIGYAVGRMGCHFSGDGDWGIINTLAQPSWWFLPDWIWSYDYPNTVLKYYNSFGNSLVEIPDCSGYVASGGGRPIYCQKLAYPVFPTPFYETVLSLIIFAILWTIRKRTKIAGFVFFVYLIFNGLERFFIEKIRVNDKIEMLGMQLTQAEIISFILFWIGVIGCIYLWFKNRKGTAA
jgi:prolipoprotein diacylglyceryl transferase